MRFERGALLRTCGPPSEDTGEAERRGNTMQHTVGALFLSTFFGIAALAAPPAPKTPPTNALVRLSSPQHDVCGTGFIDGNGYIVTNAHLVRSLCPADDCSGLSIGSAPALGAAVTPRPLTASPRVVAVLPAFDLGFIDAALPPSTVQISGIGQTGDGVATLGFPGCNSLEYSNGTIRSADALHLVTTLLGGHGSSGSPIINGAGEVVGIVDEAASFIDSLGNGPFPLRGSRLDGIGQFDPSQALPLQLERLSTFRRQLSDRSIAARIRGTFDLVVAIEGLIAAARKLPHTDAVGAVLGRGESILAAPPEVVTDGTALLAESLTVDYALQHRSSLRTSPVRAQYAKSLEKLGRSGAHLFPSPSVPTLFDLNAATLVGFGALVASGVFLFVRVFRFLRRVPRS